MKGTEIIVGIGKPKPGGPPPPPKGLKDVPGAMPEEMPESAESEDDGDYSAQGCLDKIADLIDKHRSMKDAEAAEAMPDDEESEGEYGG